jgi:hypothetical protein
VTSEAAAIERGHVLHRIDLEKVRVLDARAARCDQDFGFCEQRVASMAAPSDFWDGSAGRVLLIGLGFLAGMGVTAGSPSRWSRGAEPWYPGSCARVTTWIRSRASARLPKRSL